MAWTIVATQRAAVLIPNQAETVWVEMEAARRQPPARQQIVRTARGEVAQRPAPQALLGEKTLRVREQTVSLKKGDAGAPKAAALPRLRDLGLSDFSRLVDRPTEALPRDGAPGVAEYVKGVKAGETTALNTQEFVFYSFFERIRSQLDRAWEPILRAELIRIYKQGRRLASDQDHVTRVAVVLDQAGQVVGVEILGESGTRVLDEAAIRAFNRAGPFPNPPKALIGAQGTVSIRWEFILKT